MSKRISPAFAVTEGKVHLALPENCPYKGDAWLEWKDLRRTVEDACPYKGSTRLEWKRWGIGTVTCVEALGNRSGDVRGSVGGSGR